MEILATRVIEQLVYRVKQANSREMQIDGDLHLRLGGEHFGSNILLK